MYNDPSNIGQQRSTPSSVAKIQAQAKQAAAELDAVVLSQEVEDACNKAADWIINDAQFPLLVKKPIHKVPHGHAIAKKHMRNLARAIIAQVREELKPPSPES